MGIIPQVTFRDSHHERRETCVVGGIRRTPAVGGTRPIGRCDTPTDRPSAACGAYDAAREAWGLALRYPGWHRRRRDFSVAAIELERLAARDIAAGRRQLAEVTR